MYRRENEADYLINKIIMASRLGAHKKIKKKPTKKFSRENESLPPNN